ncbi:hypothetical protein D3C81_1585710 [compost metagenome]
MIWLSTNPCHPATLKLRLPSSICPNNRFNAADLLESTVNAVLPMVNMARGGNTAGALTAVAES